MYIPGKSVLFFFFFFVKWETEEEHIWEREEVIGKKTSSDVMYERRLKEK